MLGDDSPLSTSISTLLSNQVQQAENHLSTLEIQGVAVNIVLENIRKSNIQLWSDALDFLPQSLYQFTRKALQQLLPTAANLARWKRIENPSCSLCKQPQTNKHVLSNCEHPIVLERYLHRHNEILNLLATWIAGSKSASQTLHADVASNEFKPISDVFHTVCRPDLVLVNLNSNDVLELTVCHETNLTKSKNYKQQKYKNIAANLHEQFKNTELNIFTLEVSNLGFISDITDFIKSANLPKLPIALKRSIIIKAINSSFNIYCNRNNPIKS
jgi:hypothetical protein